MRADYSALFYAHLQRRIGRELSIVLFVVTGYPIEQLILCFMETNFMVIGLIFLLVLCLIVYLISRNKKDRKKFEQDLNQSEMKPEQHEDEKERL